MASVRHELSAGRKQSHWMWFVFPQLRALGQSPTAKRYGIASLTEAQAYIAHPVLGPRLVECTKLVQAIHGRSVRDIFGSPDDMKFRSSMTLYTRAQPGTPEFDAALDQYFDGVPDQRTLDLLAQG